MINRDLLDGGAVHGAQVEDRLALHNNCTAATLFSFKKNNFGKSFVYPREKVFQSDSNQPDQRFIFRRQSSIYLKRRPDKSDAATFSELSNFVNSRRACRLRCEVASVRPEKKKIQKKKFNMSFTTCVFIYLFIF